MKQKHKYNGTDVCVCVLVNSQSPRGCRLFEVTYIYLFILEYLK